MKLTVSPSPHVHHADTVTGIMLDVIIALVPALAASVFVFGPRSLLIVAVCVASCVFFEFISRKIMKRNSTIGDLSAVVTGMLLAFNCPVTVPLWMCVVGSAAAIILAKQLFGGIGQNFVNPAIAGRIVMLVSFSSAMTNWTAPYNWQTKADAVSAATPLSYLKHFDGALAGELPSLKEMFLGLRGGCIGEVCIAALLIGGIYLCIRRVIKPVVPLCFIGTVAVVMLIAGKGDLKFLAYELMGGGLFLGAIFMATDYSTTPVTTAGRIVFAIGCGLITSLIRLFGNLPEGVSYSIIIMNLLVPHIETLTLPKPFGTGKEKKEKEAKTA